MKYEQKSFSTPANSDLYRDNFDSIFGKKPKEPKAEEKKPDEKNEK